jgi:hypothetical protein
MTRIAEVLLLPTMCGLVLVSCGGAQPIGGHTRVPAPVANKTASGAEVEASVVTAVAQCKRAVASAPAVPAVARAELEEACGKVVNLIGKEAQELREVICNEVGQDSSSTESGRKRARRACEFVAAGG